jgi:hypothetical protein
VSIPIIHEPGRDISIASVVDVAVVGGGCAGLAAAIAAARNGARVALVERLPYLGGCVTATLMSVFQQFRVGDQKAVEGIGMEIIRRLDERGGVDGVPGHHVEVDTEKFKVLCDDLVTDAGIELWLHTLGVFPLLEGDSITGIFIESKSGRQAIKARCVVDASGDGDIAARAGAPFEMGRNSDGRIQPASVNFHVSNVDLKQLRGYYTEHPEDIFFGRLVEQARRANDFPISRNKVAFHMVRPWGEVGGLNVVRVFIKDPTDARQVTAAEVEARRQVYVAAEFLRKYVPGFANCQVSYIGAQIAPRESRRIMGEYVLTEHDIIHAAVFEDVIAKFPCFLDLHSPTASDLRLVVPKPLHPQDDVVKMAHSTGDPNSFWERELYPAEAPSMHTYGKDQLTIADGAVFDIPYRSLVPLKIDNLLVSGRCISATHEAEAGVRYLAASFATGEAAGTAAAMAATSNTQPRQLAVAALQKRLVEKGTYLGEPAPTSIRGG